jgi:hypothetical protein
MRECVPTLKVEINVTDKSQASKRKQAEGRVWVASVQVKFGVSLADRLAELGLPCGNMAQQIADTRTGVINTLVLPGLEDVNQAKREFVRSVGPF